MICEAIKEDFTYTCQLANAFGTYGGRDKKQEDEHSGKIASKPK